MILVTVFMFLYMHKIPQNLYTKFRYRDRAGFQAKRHFVLGAQLLAQARSTKDAAAAKSFAKSAAEEADRSIELDPKDAAAHILKAMALNLQGFKTSALDALNAALSPLTAKSLSDEEKGDALFKRAELKVSLSSRDGNVDSAVADLVESVKLKKNNAMSFCLLGECYEKKQMKAEAKEAYENAIRVEPDSTQAQQALDRLAS
jgi:tetratricopeptide (TPR) repeat protein